MTEKNSGEQADRLAGESLAAGDPTGWFERLYAASADGAATVPWDRRAPNQLLLWWTEQRGDDGRGRRALVVGCGFGDDAEHLASCGFDTVAFDIAPSAIHAAQQRYPGSQVHYSVADALALPAAWSRAFDFVLESQTVQALPLSLRRQAIEQIAACVAPGGTLLVIAAARGDDSELRNGPPWPLSRSEVESFAGGGLQPEAIVRVPDAAQPAVSRWCAEFRRNEPRNQAK